MSRTSTVPSRQPEPPDQYEPAVNEASESSRTSEQAILYLRLLWNRRKQLSRIALYALVASTIIAFLIPAKYESTARLMPPDNQSSSGLATAAAALAGGTGGLGGLGGLAGEFLGLKNTSELFVGILNSRTVQDNLINQFDLKKLYWDRRMEDARKDLSDNTAITVDRKSQIISLTVTDKSPQRAAAMAQAYVEALNNLVAELSTSSARRERIFLEGRLQTVNQDLEAAEKNFSQFASKNTTIDIKEQGRAMVEAAAVIQGQFIAAQSEYEGLKQIYTENNVRVRSVKARINELQHQLEKLGGKGESSSSLTSQPSDSMYPSIRKLPLLGVEYADLYRRTKIQEAVLEVLTKEYEMAKVQEAKEIPTVKILDLPNIPDKKAFPPRMLLILIGIVTALAVAAIWILGVELWRGIDVQDPRKVFAAEVFSAVSARMPFISPNGSGEHALNGKRAWMGRSKDDKETKSKQP